MALTFLTGEVAEKENLHKPSSLGLSPKQWLKISSHELLERLSFLGSEEEISVLKQFCLCESDALEAICVHMCIFTRSPLPTHRLAAACSVLPPAL